VPLPHIAGTLAASNEEALWVLTILGPGMSVIPTVKLR
jgi:hypothetical protein